MAETTLYHPNVPGLKVVREDPKEVKAHLDAGWVKDDPAVAAAHRAEEEAASAKKSEAAKKAAETRRKNAESQQPVSDPKAPKVTPVGDSPS